MSRLEQDETPNCRHNHKYCEQTNASMEILPFQVLVLHPKLGTACVDSQSIELQSITTYLCWAVLYSGLTTKIDAGTRAHINTYTSVDTNTRSRLNHTIIWTNLEWCRSPNASCEQQKRGYLARLGHSIDVFLDQLAEFPRCVQQVYICT